MPLEFRQADECHYSQILALNEAQVPHVNSIPRETLQQLHRQSCSLEVALDGDTVAGFMLALAETADYDSLNFLYFRDHYPRFAYVDRVITHPDYQRRGIGARLYRQLAQHCRGDKPLIACEVNIKPANPGSLAFHEKLGFRGVAQQDTADGAKRVQLMVLNIGD